MSEASPLTLKQFIKASLIDIVQAVEEAKEATKVTGKGPNIDKPSPIGAMFCRSEHTERDGEIVEQAYGEIVDPIQKIEFDIAVTIANRQTNVVGGSGEVKGEMIFVASGQVNVEGKRETERADTRDSRIKFSVPVLFGGRSVESHIKKTVRLPTMRAQ